MGTSLAVDARGVEFRFATPRGDLVVLAGIDLVVERGEHLAVVGRSGSGKSTLLGLLGGLDRPGGGSLEVLGHDLCSVGRDELAGFRAREVGFVFQHFGLLDTLSARENVELAGALAGLDRRERRRRADELLEIVDVAHRRDHAPPALSGGERQRVGIARALVNAPGLVLADEPTGNLDDQSAAPVAELLSSLPERAGATVVVVTHDRALASRADRVVELHAGTIAAAAAP